MTLSEQEVLEKLQAAVTELTPSQLSVLAEMAESLKKRIHKWRLETSVIVTPEFLDSFADRLLVHHAMGAEKFSKKPFEFAFVRAMRASGQQAELATSATDPGADVKVGNERYSLKSEASKKISRTSIVVSKLAEARWIREDGGNPEWLFSGIQSKVLPRFEDYEHVLILRAFDDVMDQVPAVRYELVEIPLDLLRRVDTIKISDINIAKKGKNGGGSARVVREIDNEGKLKHLFTLNFDGSVEKLKLSSLKTDECVLHASWIIPIPPEAALIDDEDDESSSTTSED